MKLLIFQWMFHPLDCNTEGDEHEYLISIQTAMRPFSGTNEVPMFIIGGEKADTRVRKLTSSEGLKVKYTIYIKLKQVLRSV